MLVPKGNYQIWPGFCLELPADLTFGPGIHYLSGANGSGKSSFLTRVLIPRMQRDVYTVYFEQQMRLQVTAIKAYAAVIQPQRRITDEAGTVDFLLENLLRAYKALQKPCHIIMDESLYAERVHEFLSKHVPSYSLIYSSHTELFPASQTINFKPLSPTQSEVYVRDH